MLEHTGNLSTLPGDPGTPRQAAYQVLVKTSSIDVKLSDPETGYVHGSVTIGLYDDELFVGVYDTAHEDNPDQLLLHDFADPRQDEQNNVEGVL